MNVGWWGQVDVLLALPMAASVALYLRPAAPAAILRLESTMRKFIPLALAAFFIAPALAEGHVDLFRKVTLEADGRVTAEGILFDTNSDRLRPEFVERSHRWIDDRLRDLYVYHGARTGRSTGEGLRRDETATASATKAPMSPVRATWVPPHSSSE